MTNRSKMVTRKTKIQISSSDQFHSIKLLDLEDTEINETHFCPPGIWNLVGREKYKKYGTTVIKCD